MKFAREGYPFIAAGVLLAVLGWVGVAVGIGGPWLMAISAVSSLLALFTLWFFRDPAPTLPADARSVVAPGQGKVISISEVDARSVGRYSPRGQT